MAEIKKFFCVKDLIIYDPFTKHKYKGNNLYGILCKKGNYIKTWYTIAEASKYYNISHACIVDCAKGVQKTSAGFVWKYDKNG